MLKKIFCAAIILAMLYGTAVLLVVNRAAAQDVPIESYSSRVKCYVMTESFINRTQYRDNRAFSVDVKFVGATVAVSNYSFRENDGLIWYSIDGGVEGVANDDEFAKRIWAFGLEYLGINYEVSYR